MYHGLCNVLLLPLISFPTSIPAVFQEKIMKWPREICHSLADTASGEQAVRATELLAHEMRADNSLQNGLVTAG